MKRKAGIRLTADDPFVSTKVIEMVLDQSRQVTDTTLKLFELSAEQFHKFMLLSAALLGLVMPILSQSGIPLAPTRLRYAIQLAVLNILIGVVTAALLRFGLPLYIRRLGHVFGEYADMPLEAEMRLKSELPFNPQPDGA